MKRIVLLVLFFAPVAAGIAYFNDPAEFTRNAALVEAFAVRLWDSVEAHPAPMLVALGTFLLTVVYHKAMGKSLRESVEVAATRVAVVSVPVPEKEVEGENRVIARAKARATRTQLVADQIGLQNRQRKLPDEIVKAEKEACYTEQAVADAKKAVADAKKALSEKHKAQNAAVAALLALRKEKAEADAELAAIEAELKKLAQLV
jgi:hypothetical protein